jgi:predicted RNA binding protein YcfA (HicA-like mRNA interferase family)
MPPVPILSSQQVVRVFESFGWRVARTGSHIIMVRDESRATLSIPHHKEVARGTLRALIRAAGLTVEEWVAALE